MNNKIFFFLGFFAFLERLEPLLFAPFVFVPSVLARLTPEYLLPLVAFFFLVAGVERFALDEELPDELLELLEDPEDLLELLDELLEPLDEPLLELLPDEDVLLPELLPDEDVLLPELEPDLTLLCVLLKSLVEPEELEPL